MLQMFSDTVLRTRLALREDGWKECEELIWWKPDAPPLGSKQRPRRTWEQILWFSQSARPFINLRANGFYSERIGFVGSSRYAEDGVVAVGRSSRVENGHARTTDHFIANVGANEKDVIHPAMFPATLCEQLILTFSKTGPKGCGYFLWVRPDSRCCSKIRAALDRLRHQARIH